MYACVIKTEVKFELSMYVYQNFFSCYEMECEMCINSMFIASCDWKVDNPMNHTDIPI